MAAGWHSALSSDLLLYGVLIGPERATHPLIQASGSFGVNVNLSSGRGRAAGPGQRRPDTA
ncbi:hypothetical protein SAMN04488058_101503 [Deinococcus reticulitermitis]|uniref:Flavin reductase like domain-containing protein n=1 Tax=Deinococcus reticulitermitis TaxID=856736 RepID=A0A1H6T3V5_9DEIO|nr:hypothetical protein [Deinococcus reticulitermitis]SEI74708.1 hypothetical protein SAMN04488058_101503 [Deinococcus reticulitermitis]